MSASIAEEALTAPLPEGWQQGLSDDGTPYHFNEETGESMWEHPMDGHYKELFQKAKEEAEARGTRAQAQEEEVEQEAEQEQGHAGKEDEKDEAGKPAKADDLEVDEFDDEEEFAFRCDTRCLLYAQCNALRA